MECLPVRFVVSLINHSYESWFLLVLPNSLLTLVCLLITLLFKFSRIRFHILLVCFALVAARAWSNKLMGAASGRSVGIAAAPTGGAAKSSDIVGFFKLINNSL